MTTPSRPISAQASRPFHLLAKPGGALCNLGCEYCFYLEKTHLYPAAKNFRMSPAVLEAYIRDYIAAQPVPVVNFAWQGGEPTLLGVDFFREVVALQQRYAQGRTIENALQTNGTLLDDEWGEFLAANRFLVGISIDGPRELHDAYRVDKGQRPTFDAVMAGLGVLKKHGVEFNTLTTVHRRNSPFPLLVYRFLREIGSGYIQFIPIVERTAPKAGAPDGLWLAPPPDHPGMENYDEHVMPWSVRPGDYGDFLCRIFDEWVERDVGRVFVQQFDAALANWAGEPAGVCIYSEKCGGALAIEHNGDIYSCDHYVYPRYRLGNLLNESLATMLDSPAQRAFGDAKSATLPKYCRECTVRFACHGECPKHRFLQTPDGEPGLNYLCAGYRKFYRHVDPAMSTMLELLRDRRAPAEIMRLPRARWSSARRSKGKGSAG
ncbi:MAG: anaerobic sulfatase-maturation protein [Opitutae bacterium]|nr:anaerobic sulfatase-maturation protein [Opitutae bacterium]